MRSLKLETSPVLLIRLGNIYHGKKEYDKAVESFTAAIQLFGGDEAKVHDTYVLLGKSLYEKGERDAAINMFLTVIKANEPKDIEHTASYLQYAKALIDGNQNSLAAQILLRILIQDSSMQKPFFF